MSKFGEVDDAFLQHDGRIAVEIVTGHEKTGDGEWAMMAIRLIANSDSEKSFACYPVVVRT